MKTKNNAKISYEPDADVLTWEISDSSIDHAKEIGNFVVHFTKNNVPVLIEILEASKFLAKTKNVIEKENNVFVKRHVLTT